MSVGLYQKRPVTVEAVQWTGDNLEEIVEFTNGQVFWDVDSQNAYLGIGVPFIDGDFVVRDSTGAISLRSPDNFLATHVKVVAD